MGKSILWFGAVVILFGLVAGYELMQFRVTDTTFLPSAKAPAGITLDGVPLSVTIADTPASQELGLGDRASLADNEGMLFVFPQAGTYAFWMKDMKFPLDIYWIATDGSIVYFKKNLSPDTYPQTFSNTKPAHYVLEINAGFADQHDVQLGDIVHFN